ITHWLTRIKVVPEAADAPDVPEIERVRGKDLEGRLSMAALARAWQMLLKGLAETRLAPSPIQAAEMVLVRLAHAADLPTPEEAIRMLDKTGEKTGGEKPAAAVPVSAPVTSASETKSAAAEPPESKSQMTGTGDAAVPRPAAEPIAPIAEERPASEAAAKPDPATLADIAALAAEAGEGRLHGFLTGDIHLIGVEPGRIEFAIRPGAPGDPGDMVQGLREFLNGATARTWTVAVSNEAGEPTLDEKTNTGSEDMTAAITANPLVRAVKETFPGATIEDVRPVASPEPFPDPSSDLGDE
ncbi:MAG: DNA polymerase III subunit gamma/tau, partial [Rhodospirillales bacterium]|nr:DNA polymerase III subunit gamma/tau [Rhodospirillales bacterium]